MNLLSLELDRPLDPEEIEEVRARASHVSEGLNHFRIDPSRPDRLEFALAPGADEARARLRLREVVEATRACATRGSTRVLWERTARGRHGPLEVQAELVRRGLLAELGRGQVALGGELLLLAEGIDRAVLGFASLWDARRYDYPMLIPLEVLMRARYLEYFPHYITFACHLRDDPDLYREIARRSWTEAAARPEHLGSLDHVLSPAVCLHAYGQFAGTEFKGPLAIAARARCARYEGAGHGGPERLWDFTMREIIFLGTPKWVSAARERALLLSIDLAQRLDLEGRAVTATDSFFAEGAEKGPERRAAFQRAFDTKYELRLEIAGGSLAAASFNLHHDHFARAFDLRLHGGPVATGCVGFGLERFAYAVACQHGADPAGWPLLARELVAAEEGRVRLPMAALEGS